MGDPPWCGHAFGRLHTGRLRDPRFEPHLRDADGDPLGFAWISRTPGPRIVVVRRPGTARLPVAGRRAGPRHTDDVDQDAQAPRSPSASMRQTAGACFPPTSSRRACRARATPGERDRERRPRAADSTPRTSRRAPRRSRERARDRARAGRVFRPRRIRGSKIRSSSSGSPGPSSETATRTGVVVALRGRRRAPPPYVSALAMRLSSACRRRTGRPRPRGRRRRLDGHVAPAERGARRTSCDQRPDVDSLEAHRRDGDVHDDPLDRAAGRDREPDERGVAESPSRRLGERLGDGRQRGDGTSNLVDEHGERALSSPSSSRALRHPFERPLRRRREHRVGVVARTGARSA